LEQREQKMVGLYGLVIHITRGAFGGKESFLSFLRKFVDIHNNLLLWSVNSRAACS
jgi:hypothetical protein